MREFDPDTARAHATISRLQAAYGDVVTRRAWDEFPGLFWPDAPVRLDVRNPERPPFVVHGADAMCEFVARALDAFVFFEFSILNTVVDVEPGADAATGRIYLCELRCDHDNAWSQAYGVYHDRYERRGDDWRIAARQYHSLARTGESVEAFGFPADAAAPPADLA